MSQPEMSVTEFSKCHTQSHLNESPNKPTPENDSFLTRMQCSSKRARRHSFGSEKNNKKQQKNKDDKTESKRISKQVSVDSTESIQNSHPTSPQERSDLFNYISKVDAKAAAKSKVTFECEKSLPCLRTGEREQNLSVPIFLYLLNNDIKSEISDLDQKEWEACHAKKWDEALRLRELTNKLNLAREHQLLNAVGLKLDEETRSAGMKSISERQDVVDKREKLISDVDLYSEDAKELWKKWETEDDLLEMNSSFIERAGLMHSLEEEWKILADEDKERISQFYSKNKFVLPTDYRQKVTVYRHN